MFTKSARQIGFVAFIRSLASQASADALNDDFSGTLSQPCNGSTQFTATLTYETDPPINAATAPCPGLAGYLLFHSTPPSRCFHSPLNSLASSGDAR